MRLLRVALVALIAGTGYALLIGWFLRVQFYADHFFDHGFGVLLYNLLRVAFIFAIAWLIYAPGVAVLTMLSGRDAARALKPGERYALGFFVGAGIWHVVLFGVGFAGGYTWTVVATMTMAVVLLSAPHLLFCVEEAKAGRRSWLACFDYRRRRDAVLLAIFLAVAGLFVCIKGLYLCDGNDYYSHYFQYYIEVVNNGSILPNPVWYHFYYSKGAGLYFLAILLTDPLAPQLVATAFVGAGALTVAMILARAAPGTRWPWVGASLYVGLMIFTPTGWAELSKIHELAAVMFLGLFWIVPRVADETASGRRMWLAGVAAVSMTTVLLTTVMVVFVGGFCLAVATLGLVMRSWRLVGAAVFGGAVAGVTAIGVMAINYALTGIPLDQALLQVWPIVDLEKIDRWGVLGEVLWLHLGMTGYLGDRVPFGWDAIRLLFQWLRLDTLWPLGAFGIAGLATQIVAGNWPNPPWRGPGKPVWLAALALLVSFSAIALSLGVSRDQASSLYRLSSFTYAPMLCMVLLLCASGRHRERRWAALSGVVIAGIVIAGLFTSRGRVLAANIPALTGKAVSFLVGRYSIKDAYQHPDWPNWAPWGGIYPAMETVWAVAGRGTPVYSLHIQSYCMLPDCRLRSWMNTRTVPEIETLLFGSAEAGKAALQRAGLNYFFYSRELGDSVYGISSPIVLSPLFSPESIDRYFGVKWTDGTSYLLTWRENAEVPLDTGFLDPYGRQVARSLTIATFPHDQWKSVFAHFRDKGLHPYRLPWCRTCAGMNSE